MANHQAIIALLAFLLTSLLILAIDVLNSFSSNRTIYSYSIYLGIYIITVITLRIATPKKFYEIAIRSIFLSFVFTIGVLLTLTSWITFGLYLMFLSGFHFTEYLSIALTNPNAATPDSFILYHSPAYVIAASASWTEFMIEQYFFLDLKKFSIISLLGASMCIIGEVLRKLAIFTAKKNFNHVVQSKKVNDHELVTHGVYSICRHPSYVGWFYWSMGTQLLLQNPICFIAYILVSWRFFKERIFIEEINLLQFFGTAYIEYQNKVGTGLPFISGYLFNSKGK